MKGSIIQIRLLDGRRMTNVGFLHQYDCPPTEYLLRIVDALGLSKAIQATAEAIDEVSQSYDSAVSSSPIRV
jgi:hypothetical protein